MKLMAISPAVLNRKKEYNSTGLNDVKMDDTKLTRDDKNSSWVTNNQCLEMMKQVTAIKNV